ncbi:hypothetical protein N9073_05280 [Akkermansiaceae bacterium]|nr:hypothetical protein [Akkermansiaceae bacterium]MDB4435477.1 hypothetical protein [bacterium]MDB4471976.1 hypothetical protein [Akkermansiaceae bacterium]MDB4482824.1 hypothetical protein [Akkermansiaceae bacterium]
MKIFQLRRWLVDSGCADEWYVCVNGDVDPTLYQLEAIERIAEEFRGVDVQVMHGSRLSIDGVSEWMRLEQKTVVKTSLASSESKNTKTSIIAPLIIGLLCFIPMLVFFGFAALLIQIIFGIIMIPVVLYIWSLVGSGLGFVLIALVSPSYADKLERECVIDFPECLRSKGYWISLCVSVVYLVIAIKICKTPDGRPVPENDKIFYLLKYAFFFALPFLAMFRGSKGNG